MGARKGAVQNAVLFGSDASGVYEPGSCRGFVGVTMSSCWNDLGVYMAVGKYTMASATSEKNSAVEVADEHRLCFGSSGRLQRCQNRP